MAAYIKTLQDATRENTIYPRTKSTAVYRDDNVTLVEDTLVSLKAGVVSVLEEAKDYADSSDIDCGNW